MPDYINAAQQRILQTLVLLAGNEFAGLAPSQIAKSLGTSQSNVTRDLANLQAGGLAEIIQDTGRWRLGPRLVQIATAFSLHLDESRRRVDEVAQRYTRTPH